MPDITSCTFVVDDDGGGAPTRQFVFSTIQQGESYQVTVTNDGIGPYGATLSVGTPQATLPPNAGARVKATGTLSLLFDTKANPNVAITFNGTLNTMHSTTVSNVVVATFD